MKIFIAILLISVCSSTYGQISKKDSVLPMALDSLPAIYYGSMYKNTIYPMDDGLTYDEYVGETIAGYSLSDGWRSDTINGGYNKEEYNNPYIESFRLNFHKKYHGKGFDYFRYKKGKKYTGEIIDTLIYYLSTQVKVVFKASCINGMLQGNGTLMTVNSNQLIAQCYFENGEIVGECLSWNINSMNETRVTYVKGSSDFTKYIELDKDGKIISKLEK